MGSQTCYDALKSEFQEVGTKPADMQGSSNEPNTEVLRTLYTNTCTLRALPSYTNTRVTDLLASLTQWQMATQPVSKTCPDPVRLLYLLKQCFH